MGTYLDEMMMWQFVLLLLVTVLLPSVKEGVKIGIICETSPYSWQHLFKVAGAISIAEDRLIENGIIQNETIER